MNPTRTLLVLMLSLLGVLGATTPALAHAKLTSSSPAQGATLAAPPSEVQLTFNEAVRIAAAPITVTGPGGASWTVGQATVAGSVVNAPVTPSGPAGQYALAYKVTSADGDPVTGTVRFALSSEASPVPAAAAPVEPAEAEPAGAEPGGAAPATNAAQDATSAGPPVWGWIALAIVVLAGAGIAVPRARRGRA